MFKRLFDKILFREVTPMISLAKTKILSAEDTPPLPDFLKVETLESQYALKFVSAKTLMLSVLRATRRYFLLAMILALSSTVISLLAPYLVNQFISEMSQAQIPVKKLILIAVSLGALGMIAGILQQFSFLQSLRAFQMTDILLNVRLYKKALQLTQEARSQYQVGDIVNLMGSDSETISDVGITLNELLSAFLLIMGSTLMMFYYFGHSAWVAIGLFALVYPLTQKVSRLFDRYGDLLMSLRDKRMTILSQVIHSIRVVKYFVWEKAITKEVNAVRDQEIETQKKNAKAEVLSGMAYMSLSTLVLFTLFFVHSLRGLELSTALVFTGVTLFALMEEPLAHISRLISRWISILVSAKRVCDFIQADEVEVIKPYPPINSGTVLSVHNLSCELKKHQILKNVHFALKPGQSLAIVGPLGAGKSVLLNVLLNEFRYEGEVLWSSSSLKKAFVSQESYIVNATLQENILFGETLNPQRLQEAIGYAALDKDIESFAGGLQTEIGEKGVNLSGGQKQRVALARAYYCNADVILLDDPLSAVDIHTEKVLIERLFKQAWKEKTIIIATHRLESLSEFDQVLFLQNGQVEAYGSYEALKVSSSSFRQFISYESLHTTLSTSAHEQKITESSPVLSSQRITEDEERAQGAVESRVYFDYLKALGGTRHTKWGIFALLLGAILFNALPMLQKWWLTNDHVQRGLTALQFVAIFGGLGLLTIIISTANDMFWLYRGLMAGKIFHDRLLNGILHAKIRFFDSTPVGRILQRFSRDIESVDRHLQWSFNSAVHTFIHFVVSLILIVSVVPLVVFFLLPILLVYYFMQLQYRRAAREMKRLDSVARSPRYAHFKETILGLPLIRAYGNQSWFFQEFLNKLIFSQRMYFSHYMLNRWFSVRIPLLGSALSIFTLLMIVVATTTGTLSAGLAGLVTVYSLNLWKSLNWFVRIFSDIESRMNSIERLKYYSEVPREDFDPVWQLESEARLTARKGLSLEFKKVQARYDQSLPLILKDISFYAEAGMKIGLVGRTGSGKSTVLQCLYRLTEIESGEIYIGGKRIQEIPLQELRRSMAMVPQDPALFLGTIRSNIDRYDEYSDEEIFAALKRVQLDVFIRSLKNQLSEAVVENGNNLSQGQKQLLCLARALLIKAQIVVMDEATASVDMQTDAIIQQVLKEDLRGVTRITIAHRLETIMDSDLIIKIDDGVSKVIMGHGVSAMNSNAAGPRYT